MIRPKLVIPMHYNTFPPITQNAEAFAAAAKWALYKLYAAKVVAKCYKENTASEKMLSSCMRRSGEDGTFYYFEKLV